MKWVATPLAAAVPLIPMRGTVQADEITLETADRLSCRIVRLIGAALV